MMGWAPAGHVDRIGAGLMNLGNTCFLNAVLQCLIHTVPLVETVRSVDHKPCFSYEGEAQFCSLCALRDLMVLCQRFTEKVVSPDIFVQNLSNISSLFKRYQQEDAHEFLHCLLDNLDGSYRKFASADPFSLPDVSIIQQTFGGRLWSVVRCCNCGHSSETFDPMLDLSLEIEYADNLGDALLSFTKVERVDDPETKFTCEGCKSQVSVEKQLKLDQVPTVIMLHLKRFKNDGGLFDKIDKHVSFPKQLDLKPFVRSMDVGEAKYDLYALVVHDGWTSYSGHYYCFIRSSEDVWHKMDDGLVYRVPEYEVSEQQAYILFYIKKGSSPWFLSLTQSQRFNTFQMLEVETSPSSVLDCRESFHSPLSGDEYLRGGSMEALVCPELDICADDNSLDLLANKSEADNLSVKFDEPCTSNSSTYSDKDAIPAIVTAKSPRSISQNEGIADYFPDESLEDEKENYYILPPVAKTAKTPRRFKPKVCNPMNETVIGQFRQTDCSSRQALVEFIPGPHQSIEPGPKPEHSTNMKRLRSESSTENENRSRPSSKPR